MRIDLEYITVGSGGAVTQEEGLRGLMHRPSDAMLISGILTGDTLLARAAAAAAGDGGRMSATPPVVRRSVLLTLCAGGAAIYQLPRLS